MRDVRLEPANGKRDNWHVRIVIEKGAHPTGEIVDAFIRRDVHIVGLRTEPITLQEVYEYYVERANVGEA